MTLAGDPSVEPLLRRAEGLVAAASALSVALDDLSIDLPPPTAAAIDQAQLRAIAALYLAAQLDAAGIVSAADDLTRLARSGALPVDLGSAAALVDALWRTRNERASEEERGSIFAALFGAEGTDATDFPPNAEFDDRMIDLCESLYKLDEAATNRQWGGVSQQARVRNAADHLLHNLSRRTSGITAFMAKEVLATVRQSIAILNHRAVHAAFAVRSLADAIAAVRRMARRPATADFLLYVRRGQSGMTILAWLAEAAPLLSTSQPLLGIDHPVIAAAIDWLEVSLTITETQAPASPDGRHTARQADPGWAALAV